MPSSKCKKIILTEGKTELQAHQEAAEDVTEACAQGGDRLGLGRGVLETGCRTCNTKKTIWR